jgi:hypothetical protein
MNLRHGDAHLPLCVVMLGSELSRGAAVIADVGKGVRMLVRRVLQLPEFRNQLVRGREDPAFVLAVAAFSTDARV